MTLKNIVNTLFYTNQKQGKKKIVGENLMVGCHLKIIKLPFCRVKDEFDQVNSMYGTDVLIGDAGYECRKYLLTPLGNPQTPAQITYNESFIRTRQTVERLFGIWKRRFPILSLGRNRGLILEVPTIPHF